jgi:hypothetical protein
MARCLAALFHIVESPFIILFHRPAVSTDVCRCFVTILPPNAVRRYCSVFSGERNTTVRSTDPIHTLQINLFNLEYMGEDAANYLHLQARSHWCVLGCSAPTASLDAPIRNLQNVKNKYADQPPKKLQTPYRIQSILMSNRRGRIQFIFHITCKLFCAMRSALCN